jgi:hypothetical protein
MLMSEIKCDKCGCGIMEASERGAYLKRVSPKGEGNPMIMECSPSCDRVHGDQNDALMNAIEEK